MRQHPRERRLRHHVSSTFWPASCNGRPDEHRPAVRVFQLSNSSSRVFGSFPREVFLTEKRLHEMLRSRPRRSTAGRS